MTYILTGASGHIGNNMARYIREREPEADIAVLTRRQIDKELAGCRVIQIIGNLEDEAFLSSHIGEGDIVLHMAGFIDLTDKKQEETYRINYDLTRLLCDVCRKNKVKKFVYTGSVDGIPRPADGGVIAEPPFYDAEKVEGHYGKSKAMAMEYVRQACEAFPDFPCATVLPSAVMGGHDYKPSAVGGVIHRVLSGGAELGIPGGYNFVDVLDVCAGMYALCHSDMRGDFILSGHNVTVKELYAAINRHMGYRRRPIIFPVWLVRPFLPFVRVLNKITLKALCETHAYTSEKAKQAFGYSPTPFEETLQNTLAFWKTQLPK